MYFHQGDINLACNLDKSDHITSPAFVDRSQWEDRPSESHGPTKSEFVGLGCIWLMRPTVANAI